MTNISADSTGAAYYYAIYFVIENLSSELATGTFALPLHSTSSNIPQPAMRTSSSITI